MAATWIEGFYKGHLERSRTLKILESLAQGYQYPIASRLNNLRKEDKICNTEILKRNEVIHIARKITMLKW